MYMAQYIIVLSNEVSLYMLVSRLSDPFLMKLYNGGACKQESQGESTELMKMESVGPCMMVQKLIYPCTGSINKSTFHLYSLAAYQAQYKESIHICKKYSSVCILTHNYNRHHILQTNSNKSFGKSYFSFLQSLASTAIVILEILLSGKCICIVSLCRLCIYSFISI